MQQAFDASLQSIMASGLELDGADDKIREQLALRIIATAQAGERNVNNLREDAIAYVMQTG